MTKIVIPDAAFGGPQAPTEWDNLMDPARNALEALIAKGDEMADRIEELEARMSDYRIEAATKEEWAARAFAAEERLAKALEALEKLDVGEGWAAQIARTTLAELTGGKDD